MNHFSSYIKLHGKQNLSFFLFLFLFQTTMLSFTQPAFTTHDLPPTPANAPEKNEALSSSKSKLGALLSSTKDFMNAPSSTGPGSCTSSSNIDPAFGCGNTESKVQVVQMYNMTSQLAGSMVVQSTTMSSQMASMSGNTLIAMEAAKNAAQQAGEIEMSMAGMQLLIAGSLAKDISRHNRNQNEINAAAETAIDRTKVNEEGTNANNTEATNKNDAGYLQSSDDGTTGKRQNQMLKRFQNQRYFTEITAKKGDDQLAAQIQKREHEGIRNEADAKERLQDMAMYANREQQGVVDMASGGMMMSVMMGSQQLMQGGSQMMSASAMQHTINQYKSVQARMINPVLPSAPQLSNPSYNAQTPAVINGNGQSSSTAATTPSSTDNSLPPVSLGDPFNTSGNNQNDSPGPTAGKFNNEASPNNNSGSNQAPSAGASTQAAPAAKEDPPPKQVTGEKAMYQSAGGIMQPGGGGNRNSNESSNPDLAKLLQALAPKETPQHPATGILNYETLNEAQPYSPIGAERDLFEEVHKEYQSLQKENVIHGI